MVSSQQHNLHSDRPGRVSLPSIHEMFPDYMIDKSGSSNSPAPIDGRRRPGFSINPSQLPPSPPFTPRSQTITQPTQQSQAHAKHSPPQPAATAAVISKGYSFDILRSDPVTSSLELISSSSTLSKPSTTPSSPHNYQRQRGSSFAGITNGSTPVFRVTVSPPSIAPPPPPSSTSCYEGQLLNAVAGRMRRHGANGSGNDVHMGYPSMITFPASGSPVPEVLSSEGGGDAGDDHDHDTLLPHEKGKKHECSICSKRFNRPSSLRIHVNTHTGATPFRCPHPTCGREFNVNSNMRRHYRNHGLPGLSRPSYQEHHRQRTRRITRSATTTTTAMRPNLVSAAKFPIPMVPALTRNSESLMDINGRLPRGVLKEEEEEEEGEEEEGEAGEGEGEGDMCDVEVDEEADEDDGMSSCSDTAESSSASVSASTSTSMQRHSSYPYRSPLPFNSSPSPPPSPPPSQRRRSRSRGRSTTTACRSPVSSPAPRRTPDSALSRPVPASCM